MKLSTKGRYAIIALVDIAMQGADVFVQLSDISVRQNLSVNYLEQLFMKLKRHGLVKSRRGPQGGYKLATEPSALRVSKILSAVDESINAFDRGAGASGGKTGTIEQNLCNNLWEGLSAQVYVYLHATRLSDVAKNEIIPCGAITSLFTIEDELNP